MDNKLIQQYGEEILCYRLRTARQKKRMRYEDFDKYLIRLYKEEKALYSQRANLGWEPLDQPFQRGWKRSFVLREDVAKSRNADFFEQILRKINTTDWSYRKDFIVRNRKMGRKKYKVKEQKLLEPGEYHFKKIGFSDIQKQLFHEVEVIDHKRKSTKKYVFNEPWRFVLCVRPHIVDRIKKTDVELERRLYEINNFLKRNCYRRRQTKLLDGSEYKFSWKYFIKHKEEYWRKDKLFLKLLNELEKSST